MLRHLRAVLSRVRGMFTGRRADSELSEELDTHLDMLTADNIRGGMSPEAARRAALLAFGGVTFAAESVRAQRSVPVIESIAADVRYGLRALRHSPVFTAVTVLTLALGIGANTAIFTVVDGVVLRPLPYPDPERLVSLASVLLRSATAVSARDFVDWRAASRSFSGLAAAVGSQTILTGAGEPERLSQARVSANAMSVLSVRPVLGRGFAAGEDEESAPRVAMLSEGLWRRRFGGDPNVVGRALLFDELPTVVVGIAPASMTWPEPVDVWMTTRFSERDLDQRSRGKRWISVVGRLAPATSLAAARSEMDAIARRIGQLDPAHNANVGIRVTPLLESEVGGVQKPLFLVLGVVGFVLLIACANVGGLMLGRLAARDAELAVRAALGASRGRIARQILTESLLLAILGAALGLVLAVAGTKALVAMAPDELPRLNEIHLNASVLVFTFGVTTLTALLFGIIPARHGAATDLHERLRTAGRGALGTASRAKARRALAIAEVSLAIVLLTGAGLLLRSFARLRQVDAGFRPEGVSTFAIQLPPTRYATPERQLEFTARLLDGIRHEPGVSATAASFALPLSGDGFRLTFDVRGEPPPDSRDEPRAQVRVAGREYFTAMGIPLLRGRSFTASDRLGAPPVLLISAEVARRYFPNEDPIGKYIETGWGMGGDARFGGEVVGIVGDVRQAALDQGLTPHLYMSYDQWPLNEFAVVVRSATPWRQVLGATRSVLAQVDANVPMNGARSLDDVVASSLGERRFYLTLLVAFAAVAVVLALAGVYGVIAYGVQQRKREIGIRLALGASRERVLAMVVGEGVKLAAIGAAIGVLAALPLTRLLDALVYGVGTRDPLTLVIAPTVLIVAATIACLLPARNAARLDPVETIRAD